MDDAEYIEKANDTKYYRIDLELGETDLTVNIDSDGNVKFNYTEPGFFVKSNETVTINGKETYLRRYIDSMNLKFHKTGDTYKLTSVIDTAQNFLLELNEDIKLLNKSINSLAEGGQKFIEKHLDNFHQSANNSPQRLIERKEEIIDV